VVVAAEAIILMSVATGTWTARPRTEQATKLHRADSSHNTNTNKSNDACISGVGCLTSMLLKKS
jgi:hypothetical protein